LELLGDIVVSGGRATKASAVDPLLAHPYVLALQEGGFAPPDPDGVGRDELRELVRRGEVIVEDGVYFAPTVIDAAANLLADMLAEQPEGVTVSEVRQKMGNTRKHAMPLIARLVAGGMTRRRDNLRIAGPRLPKR
jgi:selenocysteine-specific elongation factor